MDRMGGIPILYTMLDKKTLRYYVTKNGMKTLLVSVPLRLKLYHKEMIGQSLYRFICECMQLG